MSAPTRARGARRSPAAARRRLWIVMAGLVVIVVLVVRGALGGGGLPIPPGAGDAAPAGGANPFSYDPGQEAQFTARAISGNANVLFSKSPGGAPATAARVAAWRPMIDRATAGTGIDPALLEALVFVESAGRPQVIAGVDPAGAAGLTQILAATGQSMLGMPIDLTRSRALTRQIDADADAGLDGRLLRLEAQRAAIDARFDPAAAIAATVRYLQAAYRSFGRWDLAFESYHMGIGNLHQVLDDYDGGRPVPYARLYFDTGPEHHRAAYDLLAGFGDDSSLYYWRLLGAEEIMHQWRTDRAGLTRLAALQTADDEGAAVLHPPALAPPFADPAALAAAYQRRALVPLPRNAAALGLAVDVSMGAGASQVQAPRALYRGLRPVALRLLIDLAADVRRLSGGAAPLHVASTVADERYEQQLFGASASPATSGYSFDIDRRYVNGAQAQAFQSVLDRLESLDLIAWAREPSTIEITVAGDAATWRG